MIKAVVLDVDGVIVGDQPGVNFPLPHDEIIERFKQVNSKGVPIILCTGKFKPGIIELVKRAGLRNPHITDGGALILDPLRGEIIREHKLSKELASGITTALVDAAIYTEIYGTDDYFVQKDQMCDITDRHTPILQQAPKIVDSLTDQAAAKDIIKILAYAKDEDYKSRIESIAERFKGKIHTVWSLHPALSPYRLLVITINGVSKGQSAIEALKALNILPRDTLGVGDTAGDWKFMELCGFAATLANGDDEIKQLVRTKGEGKYFIAPHVNDNGAIDILNHFNL